MAGVVEGGEEEEEGGGMQAKQRNPTIECGEKMSVDIKSDQDLSILDAW